MLDISLVSVSSFACSSGVTVKQQEVDSVDTVTCDSPVCGVPRDSPSFLQVLQNMDRSAGKPAPFQKRMTFTTIAGVKACRDYRCC